MEDLTQRQQNCLITCIESRNIRNISTVLSQSIAHQHCQSQKSNFKSNLRMNPFCLFSHLFYFTSFGRWLVLIRSLLDTIWLAATVKSRVLFQTLYHILHIKWMFGMLNQWQLCLHAISKCLPLVLMLFSFDCVSYVNISFWNCGFHMTLVKV